MRAAELGLASPRSRWIHPHRTRGGTVILAYHYVILDDELVTGEAALHQALSDLEEHLELIEQYACVLPLGAVPTELPEHSSDGITVVGSTFDCTYTAAVQLAVPLLSKKGLRSTVS